MQSRKLQTLTSVVCKLLESLLRDHMVNFLERNNVLKDTQHGSLRGRSCLTNLLEYTEIISKWVDDGSPVDVIYLDFLKAFDKVSHQRVLIKLVAWNGSQHCNMDTKLASRQKAKGKCGRGDIRMDCST